MAAQLAQVASSAAEDMLRNLTSLWGSHTLQSGCEPLYLRRRAMQDCVVAQSIFWAHCVSKVVSFVAGAKRPEFKIGIIGCGLVGSQLVESLLARGFGAEDIIIYTRSPSTVAKFASYGIQRVESLDQLVPQVRLLYVMCLPAQVSHIATEVKPLLRRRCMLVSAVMGVDAVKLRQLFGSPLVYAITTSSELARMTNQDLFKQVTEFQQLPHPSEEEAHASGGSPRSEGGLSWFMGGVPRDEEEAMIAAAVAEETKAATPTVVGDGGAGPSVWAQLSDVVTVEDDAEAEAKKAAAAAATASAKALEQEAGAMLDAMGAKRSAATKTAAAQAAADKQLSIATVGVVSGSVDGTGAGAGAGAGTGAGAGAGGGAAGDEDQVADEDEDGAVSVPPRTPVLPQWSNVDPEELSNKRRKAAVHTASNEEALRALFVAVAFLAMRSGIPRDYALLVASQEVLGADIGDLSDIAARARDKAGKSRRRVSGIGRVMVSKNTNDGASQEFPLAEYIVEGKLADFWQQFEHVMATFSRPPPPPSKDAPGPPSRSGTGKTR